MSSSSFEDLLDYRHTVAEMYADLRRSNLSETEKCRQFRGQRDTIFSTHPQSALSAEQKAQFYPYDPAWRFVLPVDTDVEPSIIEFQLQEDGLTRMKRFGQINFAVREQQVSLLLFWLLGYGGRVFLHFRDLTAGNTTYGGGRYLLDTIKHADLGQAGDKLVMIDFNYAYNPSCAYNPQWHCPLAPWDNWLPVAIRRYRRGNKSTWIKLSSQMNLDKL